MASEKNPLLKLVYKVSAKLGLADNKIASDLSDKKHPLIDSIHQSAERINEELTFYEKRISNIEREYDRIQSQSQDLVKATVESTLKELFSELTPTCLMLLTQEHLQAQGKTTTPEQIFTVTNQLLQVLTDHGLVIFGKPGDTVSFNPNKHVCASFDENPAANDPVRILAPGAEFNGYILQRAQVQLEGKQ